MKNKIRDHAAVLLLLYLLLACDAPPPPGSRVTVSDALGDISEKVPGGFARATQIRDFNFPDDHNAHPDYKNEWWYFTGNLSSETGARFGYQVTFFRIALAPASQLEERASTWATNSIWMAHVAVTDISAKKHIARERFARAGAGLAGNQPLPFRVWLEDWQLYGTGDRFPWHLKVTADEIALELEINPISDITLQGDQGLSQKSSLPGNASYYYSITRLDTRGKLTIGSQSHTVTGLSWLDREWSTSALGEDQVGWDWFSLQLDSGEDLMYYQMRLNSGGVDPLSRGTWRSNTGTQITVTPDNIELIPLEFWESSDGTRYPIRWRVNLKTINGDWLVEATVEDQLMDLTVKYWEGAVVVKEANTGRILGRGYLEMTGY